MDEKVVKRPSLSNVTPDPFYFVRPIVSNKIKVKAAIDALAGIVIIQTKG